MHAVHPLPVGGQAVRQPLQPSADGRQVTGEIGQVSRTGEGDEPLGKQHCQLGADVGDGLGLRGGRLGRKRNLNLVKRGEDLAGPAGDVAGGGDQSRGNPVPQGVELVFGPGRFRRQHVDRGVGTVVQQGRQRAVGVGAQHQTGPRIQALLEHLDRGGDRQPQQPTGSRGHRRIAFGGGGEHRDVHRRPRIDQRGIATDDVPAHRPLHAARQLSQILGPSAQPGAFELAPDGCGDRAPG